MDVGKKVSVRAVRVQQCETYPILQSRGRSRDAPGSENSGRNLTKKISSKSNKNHTILSFKSEESFIKLNLFSRHKRAPVVSVTPAVPAVDPMDEKPTYHLKLAILGEKQVGKSSLVTRFTHDTFNPTYLYTKGGDITEQIVQQEKRTLRITIIDSAGHKYVRSLIKTLYRDVHGIMLVFDVTRRNTFEALDKWMQEINLVNQNKPVILVVGNKSDLGDFAQVSSEEAEMYAQMNDFNYIECSAKTSLNVATAFEKLIEFTVCNILPTAPSQSVKLEKDSGHDLGHRSCCGAS
ncbi:hypothetical protein RRG08_024795 [Elysia crispata]|uniref:Uncharacterized protein n=1 Tax=Elysia crispata TaxID=231223 RepID=A0AAE0YKS4_9GAST|nr:hypothetical protein RRG08_024795 [Elysia crispata]